MQCVHMQCVYVCVCVCCVCVCVCVCVCMCCCCCCCYFFSSKRLEGGGASELKSVGGLLYDVNCMNNESDCGEA